MKLGDFGESTRLSTAKQFTVNQAGTYHYMSPEVIKEEEYDAKADAWSLGVIIYELCTLIRPFQAPGIMALAKKIDSGIYAPIPKDYSEKMQKFISPLLVVDMNKRLNIAEVIEKFKL